MTESTMTTTNVLGVPVLTGEALIQKVKELNEVGAPKGAQVCACGYQTEDGSPAYTEFYIQLQDAEGDVQEVN